MIERDLTASGREGRRGGPRFVRPSMGRSEPLAGSRADTLHPAAAGVALYILVSVGRVQELVPFLIGLPLGKIAVVLALVGLFMAPPGRNRAFSGMPLSRHLILLSLLATFSVAVSVWGGHSLEFLLGTFLGNVLLFYLLVRSADNSRTRNLYVGALVLSAIMLCVPALSLSGIERSEVSTAYDANDLASVIVTVMPFCVVAVFAGRRKIVWTVVSLIMAAAVVATGSRGGFLGLLASAAYLAWAPLPGRRKAGAGKGVRAAVLVLVGLFSVAVVGGAAWERISTITSLDNDYNLKAETGRLAIWQRGLSIMAQRPWGVGLDAFEAAEGMEGGRYKAAHNSLIQVGAELGIAGLLVFISMCLSAFRLLGSRPGEDEASEKSLAPAAALRAGLLGFFVTGMFLSHAYAPVLYALLGMAVAVAWAPDKARVGDRPSKRGRPHEISVRTARR